MAKSNYADLATSLKQGDWQCETDLPNWAGKTGNKTATKDQINTACLIDIMTSLRAIRRHIECPNVSGGFKAMREAARTLKTRLPVPKKAKAKRAKPKH